MLSAIVETRYGRLHGEEQNGIFAWKGIPYATPPIGELRFRAPQPLSSWSGVRNATRFAASCSQPANPFTKIMGENGNPVSEDCLNLNIWSPGADNKKRPVLVWIHGGGFWFDSACSPWYDGASFAREGDVVFVSINYRLGPLGFLHLADLGGNEFLESGNCGLLDQVEALKWVRDNISAFGGDPDRVTICGESAGGEAVAMLLGMSRAKGLFNRAILQSFAADLYCKSADATEVAKELLNILDIKPNELRKLKEIPVESILEASVIVRSKTKLPAVFSPVIDGSIVPLEPIQAVEAGFAKDVSILIGANKEEYGLHTFVVPVWGTMDDTQKIQFIKRYMGPLWPYVKDYYSIESKTGEQLKGCIIDAMTALRFNTPVVQLAEHQVNHGASVWMYRFDWKTIMFDGKLGACHFLEVPFVFNQLDHQSAIDLTGDSPLRKNLSIQMHQSWIAFARNGNPNTSAIPEWPNYELSDRSTMIFDHKSEAVSDPNKEERLAWEHAVKQCKQ